MGAYRRPITRLVTGKYCNSMSGMEWRTGFRQRQRLPHGIGHADSTIFSTMADEIFPVVAVVASFAGRVGHYNFFAYLCSPRATVVFNRCSRQRCCSFCRNRPPRHSIACVRELDLRSIVLCSSGILSPTWVVG